MSAQKPIVVVRSIHTDLVALTGKNPAAGETVIGIGFQMRQIGRLGSDAFGAQLRAHLESAG